jgi:thiamine biosynthesis lipoprotein
MATRFEVLLLGENEVSLRAAGEEALDEIQRIEAQLSLYQPTSQIAHLNATAAIKPVRVEPSVFRLLQQAQRLSRETDDAFDITVAPLMRCWGFMQGKGKVPDASDLALAKSKVGMHLVQLNEADFTVQFRCPGVMLDLGSIGKGYALERAAGILREAGVSRGILHGGTSTVCAIGAPPDGDAWKVGVPHPEFASQSISLSPALSAEHPRLLAIIPLRDESLSVSAVWGRSFEAEGKVYGHVIDPRKGEPVDKAVMAAAVLPSATETDALSTALLICGASEHQKIRQLRVGMRSLIVGRGHQAGQFVIDTHGVELCAP